MKEKTDNSCVKCANELTCGYSLLATTGRRGMLSWGPCVLGLMSSGRPFFDKKEESANDRRNGNITP